MKRNQVQNSKVVIISHDGLLLRAGIVLHHCVVCGQAFVGTRKAMYCSSACRQYMYRLRRRASKWQS